MSVTGLASSAASSTRSSSSFSSGFMGMPPTQSDGGAGQRYYVRLGNVPYEKFGLSRNRYRPIMTFGNPADFVSGPQNAGDSKASQEAQGGGSFSTAVRKT